MNKEEFNLKIGQFIRIEREKLNFSIRELERRSGVSRMVISQLEGATPFQSLNPRIHSLKKLLESLDKSFYNLFDHIYEKERK